MNLLPSAEQVQIVDSLRGFLAAEAPLARFRPVPNSASTSKAGAGAVGAEAGAGPAGQADDGYLWRGLGALGCLGIAITERQGGTGLGAAEEMLVYRELGRALVSPAVLGISLGARIAARAGDAALCAALLAGEVRVGLANPRGGAPDSSDAFHLIAAQDADWLLACGEQGAALHRREDFAHTAPVPATDSVLALERATLRGGAPALRLAADHDPIHRRALLLLGAYAVGMAMAYAKLREQFGQPIGAFQAVKHRCADMAIRAEAALCQASFAALSFEQSFDPPAGQAHASGARDDAGFQVRACRLAAVDAALKNAAANIQVHGAIGFTAEADAHLFLKRAHLVDLLWGDVRRQRAAMLDADFPE